MKRITLLVLVLLNFIIFMPRIPHLHALEEEKSNDVETVSVYNFTELKSVTPGIVLEPTIEKERVTNRWIITIDYKEKIYKLYTKDLPHEANEEMKVKYKGVAPRSMKFWTDDEKTYLWYDFQNNPADGTIMAELSNDANIYGFRPFVLFNITDSLVDITDKLIIPGVTRIIKDYIYFDIVFPMDLDSLLQISMMYTTQSKKAYIFKGPEKTHVITRINGEQTLARKINMGGFFINKKYALVKKDDIEEITSTLQSVEAQNKFMATLNTGLKEKNLNPLTKSDVFKQEYSAYRIFGSYEHDFAQTKLKVSDVTITEVLYQYKGEFFHVPAEDIESYIAGAIVGTGAGDMFQYLSQLFGAIDQIVLILLVIVGAVIVLFLLSFIPVVKPLIETLLRALNSFINMINDTIKHFAEKLGPIGILIIIAVIVLLIFL